MKLFQSIQVYFASLGIKPPSEQLQKYPFNTANVLTLIVMLQFAVSTTAFFVFDARNFKQIADSFYPSSNAISGTVNFIVVICNLAKIFKLIENYETALRASKTDYINIVRYTKFYSTH